MVYINIPYVPENNRINKDLAQKELQALDINDEAKQTAFKAIYNRLPHGVSFSEKDLKEAFQLEKVLSRLGIPYRESEESEWF
jgi:hypothetical protein